MLLNLYKNGTDYISKHHDNEDGWNKKSGFSTLAFGCIRNLRFTSISGVPKNNLH